jgi:hypothetical protein
MKGKKFIIPAILSIIPFAVLIFNLADVYDVFFGDGGYPFGSEFFSPYSIYRTKAIYVLYDFLFSIILILTIYFAFKVKLKLYILFLLVAVVFLLYPMCYST